jgi:hypothetical protein
MLKRPIYKERFSVYSACASHNAFQLSKNHSPEAIAILEQYEKENLKNLTNIPDNYYTLNLKNNPYASHIVNIKAINNKYNIFSTKIEKLYKIVDYEYVINNIDKVDWEELSENPNAIPLLEQYQNRIKKINFLKNPNSIRLIKKLYTYDELFNDINCICSLIINPNGKEILQYYEKPYSSIPFDFIIIKPGLLHLLFTWDYKNMEANNWIFKQELVSKVFAPKRLFYICKTYNLLLEELVEMY